MKILVTDASNQMGIELKNVLETRLPGVTTYASADTLDLGDPDALRRYLERGGFTHVVNCATYPDIDRAEEESGLCASINTEAVRNLAINADDYGFKIIHISSSLVFDGTSCRPYNESDKVNPTSQYGATKRKGETSLLALAPESVIIRTGWVYSPYGTNIVKAFIDRADQDDIIGAVCDRVSSPTYAFDLANAIYAILTSHQWVPGFFNFGDEGVATPYDLAKAIFRILGRKDVRVVPLSTTDVPTIATRPCYSVLDNSRIKATYSIGIPHWEEALAHCLARIKQ